MINFISECLEGGVRVSHKVITNQSGFLDVVEPYDTVLADRGFPIRQELTLKRARLLIPPGGKVSTKWPSPMSFLPRKLQTKEFTLNKKLGAWNFSEFLNMKCQYLPCIIWISFDLLLEFAPFILLYLPTQKSEHFVRWQPNGNPMAMLIYITLLIVINFQTKSNMHTVCGFLSILVHLFHTHSLTRYSLVTAMPRLEYLILNMLNKWTPHRDI